MSLIYIQKAPFIFLSMLMLQIRKDGVRLFIIWYQILQEHNDIENHELYSKLVALTQDSESYLSFSDSVSAPSVECECSR